MPPKAATVAAPGPAGAAPAEEESTRGGLYNILRTVAMFFLMQAGMSLLSVLWIFADQ